MSDEQYQELLAKCMRKAEREKEEEERMSKTKKTMLVFDTTNLTSRDSDGRPALRVEEIEREGEQESAAEEMHSNMWSWDELAEAVVAQRRQILELEGRNVELEQRLCIMVERAENREARLKEAEGNGEALREVLTKYFNIRIEDVPSAVQGLINSATYNNWRALDSFEKYMEAKERAEKAEADAVRLREALRRVEWVSGWDVEGHKAIYCPWCNRIKGFGHVFGCIRQAALSPTEQADDEKGVK